MLGDAEAVIDRPIAALGKKPGRTTDQLRLHAGELFGGLRAVLLFADETGPVLELGPVATLADELFVEQAFGDDDMRQRRQHGHVGARLQRQVIIGLHMRRLDEIDAARIDDDQFCALTEPLLEARAEHRMPVGRVGADDDDDIGMLDRVEILRAGRGAERLAEAVAGRRMADAGAGIDIVIAETGADQLLDEEGLLVGAARRGDAADRIPAVLILDTAEFEAT